MSDALATLNRLQRLEDDVVRLTDMMFRLRQSVESRLAAIESPAPAPDPVCAREGCGHPKSEHRRSNGTCRAIVPGPDKCSCHEFVPAPPAAPEPLDPGFRVAIREAVVRWADLGVTSRSVDDITDAVIATMRTYRRDGAR